MDGYLELQKLCLEIQMTEFENYLNDPATQFGLECARLTNPEAYEEAMQKCAKIREDYERIMAIC